jgi:hypothetical protein
MPKGTKMLYSCRTTFYLCPCGYAIENNSKKLIEMKTKLHKKMCSKLEQDNVEIIDIGRINLSVGQNQHHINTEAYCLKQVQ